MPVEEKKDECLTLIRSTNRPDIGRLISRITKKGYFEAPTSLNHHSFKGDF